MPREFSRARRVSEQIQRELADLLARKVSDPRLHAVTVSAVDVSPDLAQARVYVTPPAATDAQPVLGALSRAAGFLRRELSRRLRARTVPRLIFIHDETLDRVDRLTALFDEHIDGPHAGAHRENGDADGD